MTKQHAGSPFPIGLLVLDAVGGVALALGAVGLVSGGSVLPFLAEQRVAWALVASGAALTLYAGLEIAKRIRGRKTAVR
ncbi:MAG: hypothetical protein MUF79_07525 [Burkholderiales bacterium]|jgi:hypothetical protein|nr:hypothetical protein [Burkholderiales bacterium]